MPTHGPRDTMHQQVDAYLTRRRPHIARSTYDDLRSTLGRFATWWDGTRKVPRSLREQDVEAYAWGRHKCVAGCRGRVHRGPGLRDTVGDLRLNQDLSQIHSFLMWGIRYSAFRPEVVEPLAPHRRVKPRRVRRRRLTADQLVELVEGCSDPWERIVVALAINTACRSGELNTLRVGDVDLETGEIEWDRHKTGDSSDYLPITADLEIELERWFKEYERACGPLRGDWYLIPHRHTGGNPGTMHYKPTRRLARGCWVTVKKHLVRVLGATPAELNGEGVHTVRRSMARCLYERLCDDAHPDPIAVVQALLGHAHRQMTERYIGVESGRRERDRVLRGRSMLRRS